MLALVSIRICEFREIGYVQIQEVQHFVQGIESFVLIALAQVVFLVLIGWLKRTVLGLLTLETGIGDSHADGIELIPQRQICISPLGNTEQFFFRIFGRIVVIDFDELG